MGYSRWLQTARELYGNNETRIISVIVTTAVKFMCVLQEKGNSRRNLKKVALGMLLAKSCEKQQNKKEKLLVINNCVLAKAAEVEG